MRIKEPIPSLELNFQCLTLEEAPKEQTDGKSTSNSEKNGHSVKNEEENVRNEFEETHEGLLVPKGLEKKDHYYYSNARQSSHPYYHRQNELRDCLSSSLCEIYPLHSSPLTDYQANIPTTVLEHETSTEGQELFENNGFDFDLEDFMKLGPYVDHLANNNPLPSPDSAYLRTYSPCGNSGHTPSSSPPMSQSDSQLTDDSAYSSASSCSPQTSPPQGEPSYWNIDSRQNLESVLQEVELLNNQNATYTDLQTSTTTRKDLLGSYTPVLGGHSSANFTQNNYHSFQLNIPYSTANNLIQQYPERKTVSPTMPDLSNTAETHAMNIPSSTAQSTAKTEQQKKTNNSFQRAVARPKRQPKLLPSSVGPAKLRTKSTKTLSQTPKDKVFQLTKPERIFVVWKTLSKQTKEDFNKKNQSLQTNLMQALLRSPKPPQLAELVYCCVERMKNNNLADLLTCRDESGHSALYQAAIIHPERPEIAAYIAYSYAELGRNVNEVFADGNTLIHNLCKLGSHQVQVQETRASVSYEAMLKELLDLKKDGMRLFNPNIRNDDGNTALHIAAQRHQEHNSTINLADILMKRGADASIQNNRGEIPLHIAAKSDSCEPHYFKKLLEQPGTANIQDECMNTPLHLVAYNVNINNIRKMERVMEHLLTSSASTEIKNNMERTPIMNIHQDCKEEFKALFHSKKLSSK